MTTTYPGALDVYNNPGPNTFEDAPGFELDLVISNLNDAVRAIETKLGIGGAAPGATAAVLRRTAAGASAWAQLVDADVAAAAQILVSKLNAGGVADRVVRTLDGANVSLGQINNAMISPGQISGDRLQDNTLDYIKLIAGAAQVHGWASDSAAASLSTAGAYATVPGMAVPLTVIGADVLVFGIITVYYSTAPSTLFLAVREAGGSDLTLGQHTPSGAGVNTLVPFLYLIQGVAAGARTFNLRWQTASGTLNRNGASFLGAMELRR